MKIFKSHFWYNKSQRNGIFFLAIIIIILQFVIVFVDFSSKETIDTDTPQVIAFRLQIDELKAIEIENRRPKIYSFNPNYITDYKGEQLGMSLYEIDKLLAFRKTGKFINSKNEFQQVTKISDSLLRAISPYFKFPDWVVKRSQGFKSNNVTSNTVEKSYEKSKYKLTSTDINKATEKDLQTISGIGTSFSERIIKYRTRLQGYSLKSQLYEVWGIEKEVVDKVLVVFKIIEKPTITKANINSVTFKDILKY